jgi:hypothetical protein
VYSVAKRLGGHLNQLCVCVLCGDAVGAARSRRRTQSAPHAVGAALTSGAALECGASSTAGAALIKLASRCHPAPHSEKIHLPARTVGAARTTGAAGTMTTFVRGIEVDDECMERILVLADTDMMSIGRSSSVNTTKMVALTCKAWSESILRILSSPDISRRSAIIGAKAACIALRQVRLEQRRDSIFWSNRDGTTAFQIGYFGSKIFTALNPVNIFADDPIKYPPGSSLEWTAEFCFGSKSALHAFAMCLTHAIDKFLKTTLELCTSNITPPTRWHDITCTERHIASSAKLSGFASSDVPWSDVPPAESEHTAESEDNIWEYGGFFAALMMLDKDPLINMGVDMETQLLVIKALARRAGIPRYNAKFTRMLWALVVNRAACIITKACVVASSSLVLDDNFMEVDDGSSESESSSDSSDSETESDAEENETESDASRVRNEHTDRYRPTKFGYCFTPTADCFRKAYSDIC